MMTVLEGFRAVAADWGAQAALAAADVDPVTGKDPEWGKAAPAGILIWVILGAALFLLIKSMNRHFRRVPETFEDEDAAGAADVESEGAADSGGSTGAEDAAEDASAVEGVISESGGAEDSR